MKNLKFLKNLKNLKKSGNLTSSQEKLSEKPEKDRNFISSQEKVSIFLQIAIKSKKISPAAQYHDYLLFAQILS